MGHVDPPDRTQTLEGTLERITFQNDETGYTVARLIPRGKTHEVTIIGALAGLNVGEAVRLRGAGNSPQTRPVSLRSAPTRSSCRQRSRASASTSVAVW